jgi:hypothetical protein
MPRSMQGKDEETKTTIQERSHPPPTSKRKLQDRNQTPERKLELFSPAGRLVTVTPVPPDRLIVRHAQPAELRAAAEGGPAREVFAALVLSGRTARMAASLLLAASTLSSYHESVRSGRPAARCCTRSGGTSRTSLGRPQ